MKFNLFKKKPKTFTIPDYCTETYTKLPKIGKHDKFNTLCIFNDEAFRLKSDNVTEVFRFQTNTTIHETSSVCSHLKNTVEKDAYADFLESVWINPNLSYITKSVVKKTINRVFVARYDEKYFMQTLCEGKPAEYTIFDSGNKIGEPTVQNLLFDVENLGRNTYSFVNVISPGAYVIGYRMRYDYKTIPSVTHEYSNLEVVDKNLFDDIIREL